MPVHRAILAAVALLFVPAIGGAQYVHGTIRDAVSNQPVGGSVVWLADSADRLLLRAIGDPAGHYNLFRMSGAVHLHIVHIGFRPVDIRLTRTSADTTIDIQFDPLPPMLATVQTSSKRVCPGEVDGGDALTLWEQARAALLASLVARQTTSPKLQLIAWDKKLEAFRARITESHFESKFLTGSRSYVAARPAWAFALEGYMHEELGGQRIFYAPDEEVLLDATFVETHCLHVVNGGGKSHPADDIGLAFEPVPNPRRDTIVDVTGVLWIDRKLSALRSLEFKYTALERAADRSDGNIVFRVMPNGTSMVQSWTIRSTSVVLDERPSRLPRRIPDRVDRADARAVGYQEEGGIVAAAEWPDGTKWHAELPRVTGMVADSAGEPVAGARVWIRESGDTVITRDDGRFELPYVLPGRYAIMASDSLLALRGISRSLPRVVGLTGLAMSGDSHLQLRLHSRAEVLASVCPARMYRSGTGVILGRVVTADGTPVENPRIELESLQAIVARDTVTRRVQRTGEANDDGEFVICGASLSQPLLVRARKKDESATVTIEKWTDEVAVVTLVLKAP